MYVTTLHIMTEGVWHKGRKFDKFVISLAKAKKGHSGKEGDKFAINWAKFEKFG